MKVCILFSGGKDSTYAAWLAKKEKYDLSCLISIFSENKESYMFHTPAIEMTKKQAKLMKIPLLIKKTKGKKEKELLDLKKVIEEAIKKYRIEGVVSGAIESVYQASRIQRICNEQKIKCFNPLWQKNQIDLLKELIDNNFEVILSSVAAYPLDKNWIGKKIDEKFIEEIKELQRKYKINPAGEGGEYETLVINCPLFKKRVNTHLINIIGEGNSWRGIFK